MMNRPLILIFILSAAIICLTNSYAQAAFSLSVTPYEGGYDLRYGKINPASELINKELNVNITSDIAKQYRLIQTLLEPLTNAQGISIVPQRTFFVSAIRGTNRYGTLNVEQEIPVSLVRTVIYTSNVAGASDSFNLVYTLKGPFDAPSGSYRGRIGFTLEPVDSTQEPVTVILNIFAEIEVESSIEIKTLTGSRIIALNPAKEEKQAFDVLFDIKGSFGSQVRILQLLTETLKSQEGSELPYEAVNFMLSEVNKGSGPTQATPLSARQEVIYNSSLKGEADSFVVTYTLGDLSKYKAGRYKANLNYLFEQTLPAQTKLIDTFGLEVEIERVFDILIKTESGTGTVEFRNLKPRQPPQTYEVFLEVKSNTAKSYQVTQNIFSELVSKEGLTIPAKYFTLRTEGIDTKGTLRFGQKSEVRSGDTVLFISDKAGSPDSFKVVYELEVPPDIKAGDYSTSITYSLSEI